MTNAFLLILSYVMFLVAWGGLLALFCLYQRRLKNTPEERNIDILEKELNILKKEINKKRGNRDIISAKIAHYESELNDINKSLELNKKAHERELHRYREEKRTLVDRVKELREQTREREARLTEVRAEVGALEERREAAAETVASLAGEADRLRGEREVTGEALRALRRQVEETEKQLFESRRAARDG
jgi:chromosome segregation ATPase